MERIFLRERRRMAGSAARLASSRRAGQGEGEFCHRESTEGTEETKGKEEECLDSGR